MVDYSNEWELGQNKPQDLNSILKPQGVFGFHFENQPLGDLTLKEHRNRFHNSKPQEPMENAVMYSSRITVLTHLVHRGSNKYQHHCSGEPQIHLP